MIRKRKMALLVSVALLACAYAVQLVLSRPESVKTLAAESAIDSIEIERPDSPTLALSKSGASWVIGEARYPADASRVESMLSLLGGVKILGTVASDASRGEYGLEDGSAITVNALSGGKKIRSVRVGKGAVNSMQTYASVDGEKAVRLLSGNYRGSFGVSADELRSREVWTLETSSVTRVSSERDSASFALEKGGEPAVWSLAAGATGKDRGVSVDAEKAGAWVAGLASLKAQSFALDGTAFPDRPLVTVTLTTDGAENRISVYEKGKDGTYLCAASTVSSPFYLSSWSAEKLLKPLSELAK